MAMAREILIDVGIGETRIALIDGDRLASIRIERPERHSLIGSIWLGRVIRVVPGMQAAFVDLGLSRAGFLAARDARALADNSSSEETPSIGTLLHEGQAIVVEVSKDPVGDKGVKLSAEATLPGRYLVYAPRGAGIHLSRRIEDAAERERLTLALEGQLGAGDGFIVRTAAIGAAAEALREEAVRLRAAWAEIVAHAAQAKLPTRLWHDLDSVERALRDHLTAETERVRINSRPAFTAAKKYAASALPRLADRIELHSGPMALLELYGIEADIARALEKRVALPSGGAITIEATQALTAIDVDSGSFTAGRGLEETSLRTNLEAADEIARQLRLRGIGGIIVIDFIHLEEAVNREALLAALRAGLASDRAPTRVLGMSEFGLVELTRKRTGEPLVHAASEACTHCAGEGRVASIQAVAAELARRAEREAVASPGRPLTLVAAPEVVEALQAWDCLGRLAEQVGATVQLRADSARRRHDCDVLVG
jgi:ribonuclease G